MSNFISVITYNVKDEQGNVTNQAMRLVNAPSNIIASAVGQIMETSNWVDQVVIQRQTVNAVFPPAHQPTETENATEKTTTKSSKSDSKKGKTRGKASTSKSKTTEKKGVGRGRKKAA
jgi:hypothetical protein